MAGQGLQWGPAWVGPDLGCVIIGTSEQEIPMDSYKRKGKEFKYSKEHKKIKGIIAFSKTQHSDLCS